MPATPYACSRSFMLSDGTFLHQNASCEFQVISGAVRAPVACVWHKDVKRVGLTSDLPWSYWRAK